MTTPTCTTLLAYFSDYLDGEAPPAVDAALVQHLASCTECRAVVATLRKTVTLYHELPARFPRRGRLFHRLDLDEFLADP
ncbi:MAG: zf-HC2 domain-containing protein [Anaerolineae bacterium]|nr:MAG: zf-HC2 domain-containing protein [Anaerolineae bacterium]